MRTLCTLLLLSLSLLPGQARADSHTRRYLYVVAPGIRDYLEFGGAGIVVFDLDDGYRFVKRIATPASAEKKPANIKGVVACPATRRLYFTTPRKLYCVDLVSAKTLWEKALPLGCDRPAITPDGKLLYVPSFEKETWNVVSADGELLHTITTNSGAHNTVCGLDGKRMYLGGLKSNYLFVADTATHKVVSKAGPLGGAVRPFVVNAAQSLAFVCVNGLLGFEVADLKTGKLLHRVEVAGFKQGKVKRHGCPSHGVGLTPDEKEAWVCDAANSRLHVFDVSALPPKQTASIALREQPGWVTFSLDGRWAWPSTGEVIDTKTKKIVHALKDEEGREVHSEKVVEIHFQDGVPVRAGDQFGLGRAMTAAEYPMGLDAAERGRGPARLIVETDAGGDPDDEQSLVRFLLYANEWDVEGIIANRPKSRDRENLNPERTGLGVVRRLVKAYGECHPNLVRHDRRYPTAERLLERTVPGYEDKDDGVKLVLAAVDADDPRPVWFLNWGTDNGAATSCLNRALDRVLKTRGPKGYAAFKSRLRVIGYPATFGDHATKTGPPFPLLVDTFRPPLEGKRWYHRFSALTATAGGFDLERDVRTGHGPLGALYPTNTTHRQKEGDTTTFLYLVPTGLNDPERPGWGSWGGRHGSHPELKGRNVYWANQADAWGGTTHRDNTLKRWAVDLQNDFRARLDWCVKPAKGANHPPVVVVNGRPGKEVLHLDATAGATLKLDAAGSSDPDGDEVSYEWYVYPEAGTYRGDVKLDAAAGQARLSVPADAAGKSLHVVLAVRDRGAPPLVRYCRVVVSCGAGGR